MKNQKGFSLVELLVVVIIIAIIAAIAIPSLLASRRAANEASAISSLRSIHSANVTYFSTTGGNSDYGTLDLLAGAGLIDTTLGAAAAGVLKSGYTFDSAVGAAGSGIYCVESYATTQGTTGTRSFGIETEGVLYAWADGSANGQCVAGDLDPTGGVVIQ